MGATNGAGTTCPSGTPEFVCPSIYEFFLPLCSKSNTTDATSGIEMTHPFRAHEYIPGSCCSIFFFICSIRSGYPICPSLGHYIVCLSSIDGFWLLLWYRQAFLQADIITTV
jgi:hypothetical protein